MMTLLRAKLLMWRWRFMGNRIFMAMAKRRAIKKHQQTGKHYSVYFIGGRYRVMTRDDLQRAKHTGVFNWRVNATSMREFVFYSTQTSMSCLSTSTN